MQVPASANPGLGASQVSGSISDRLLETLAGSVTAEKEQQAPFAAILAEQSSVKTAARDMGILPSAKEDSGTDPLAEEAELEVACVDSNRPSIEQKTSVGIFSDPQSNAPIQTKEKTESGHHRKTASTSSHDPRKKPESTTAAGSILLPAAVTALLPVAALPTSAVAKDATRSTAKIPLDHSVTSQIDPLVHGQKLEAETVEPALAANSEFPKTEGSPSSASNPVRHESNSDSPAKFQSAPSPTAVQVVQADQVAQAHNPAQTLRDSSPVPGRSSSEAVSRADAVVHNAVPQPTIAASPKQETNTETSGDAMRKPGHVTGSGGSSTNPASSYSAALTMAVSGGAATGDANPKQAAVPPEVNAFQQLDAGVAPGTLLHSSAHQVAVGVHDPSLGWVEVQTQSSAGHVSATLTTASFEAHANLAAQAPAITQYLADRNVFVHSVQVHAQVGAQSGGSGGDQPQPHQAPPEQKNLVARARVRPLSSETKSGNMPQPLNARISVHA